MKTGNNAGNGGSIDILVDSGGGYIPVTTPGRYYNQSEVVLDDCFDTIEGVRVFSTTNNAWIGPVKVSSDGKETYSSLKCIDCVGSTLMTWWLAVDGDDDMKNNAANCLNGDTCTLLLNVEVSLLCLILLRYFYFIIVN